MGQGKSPWYTHRLMHRKRVTSELHDSYFRLMTIKHAIPKIEWAIEWAIEQLYKSVRQEVRRGKGEFGDKCGRESQQKAEPPDLRSSIRRTRTTHGYVRRGWFGQYVAVFVRFPTPSHTQTLQIKWEVYFFKEGFARLFIYCVVIILNVRRCICMWEYNTTSK